MGWLLDFFVGVGEDILIKDPCKKWLEDRKQTKELFGVLQQWQQDTRWDALRRDPGILDIDGLLVVFNEDALYIILTHLTNYHASAETQQYPLIMLYEKAYEIVRATSDQQRHEIKAMVMRLVEMVRFTLFGRLNDSEKAILGELGKVFQEKQRSITARFVEGMATLRETIVYKDSFAEYIDSMRTALPARGNLFDYRNTPIKLHGRDKALREWRDFLDDERPLLWWGLCGDGGSGKSRFALELCNELNNGESQYAWHALFAPDQMLTKNWSGKYEHGKNLLIVIDYASRFANEVQALIRDMAQSTRVLAKIRIMLVEREGERKKAPQQDDGISGKLSLQENLPLWVPQKCMGSCYEKDKPTYTLPPIEEETQRDIIFDFCGVLQAKDAAKYSRPLVSREDSDFGDILSAIQSVDPGKMRTLYLLFLSEAWMREDNIRQWKRDELLSHIYKRECEHLTDAAKEIDKENLISLQNGYMQLWGFATASEEIPIAEIGEASNNTAPSFIHDVMKEQPGIHRSLVALIRELDGGDRLRPYTPDIPGEFLVLKQITEESPQRIKAFVQSAWRRSPARYSRFLFRVAMDFQEDFTSPITEHPLYAEPENVTELMYYADMLYALSFMR